MKVLVGEVDNEGLVSLLGKSVTLWCGIYIYTGKLIGVNDDTVKLADAKIVYETGPLMIISGRTPSLWKLNVGMSGWLRLSRLAS